MILVLLCTELRSSPTEISDENPSEFSGSRVELITKAVLFGIAGVWDAGDAFGLCAHFLWFIRAVAFGFSAPGRVFAVWHQRCFVGFGAYCATRQMFQQSFQMQHLLQGSGVSAIFKCTKPKTGFAFHSRLDLHDLLIIFDFFFF